LGTNKTLIGPRYIWIPEYIPPPHKSYQWIRYWDGETDFLEFDGGWYTLEGWRVLRNIKEWYLLLK